MAAEFWKSTFGQTQDGGWPPNLCIMGLQMDYIAGFQWRANPKYDVQLSNIFELGKVHSNCKCLADWGRLTSCKSFWLILAKFVLRMCQTAIFQLSIKILTSLLDSATPIPKSEQKFCDQTTLWPWPLTLWTWMFVGHVIKLCTKLHRNRTIHGWVTAIWKFEIWGRTPPRFHSI